MGTEIFLENMFLLVSILNVIREGFVNLIL